MDPREAFGFEVGRISRRWRARLDERLRGLDLSQARWMALLQLSRAEGVLTQRELAERLGIEGPTLVRQLDRLEQHGLIERCPVAADRRAKHVRLTETAGPILAEINRIAGELRREILGPIDVGDLANCVDVLRRIGDRLEGQ